MENAPSSTATDAADRVIETLNRPDPVAGVGDPTAALEILRTLSGEDLIAALIIVDNNFLLDLLVSTIGTSDTTEVGAAIYVVRFTSPHGTPDDTFGIQAARGLAGLPVAEQDRLIAAVLSGRGSAATVAEVREGMEALQESESTLTAEGYEEVDDPSAAPAPLMAGIAMGPWSPGRVPIPFYIGNSAHIAIAAYYAGLHATDAAFYNFSPISAILDAAVRLGIAVNPAAVTASRLGLRPDITNLTRRHLYEIKPASAQSVAAAEARIYVAAFALAGLPIALGPITEPGTSGTVPGPGGWYVFTSPEPGVVTYHYRQPRRRRVRAPERSRATSRSFMEEMEVITGLTGAALVIYIIISEGSRVIPIRNAIPVP